MGAIRTADETATNFLSRLQTLFDFYINARKVKTFLALVDLVVVDRLKTTLSIQQRFYIADKEITEGNLTPARIATLLDAYENEHGRYRPQFKARERFNNGSHYSNQQRNVANAGNEGASVSTEQASGAQGFKKPFQRTDKSRLQCTTCGAKGHVSSTCFKDPKNKGQSFRTNYHRAEGQNKRGNSRRGRGRTFRANRVVVEHDTQVQADVAQSCSTANNAACNAESMR